MNRLFLLLTVCALLLLGGCYQSPSESDLTRLKLLEGKHPNFMYELKYEFYLKVRSRRNVAASEADLIEVYKTFFFDEANTRRRETTFIYLNYYDFYGVFQYQLTLEPNSTTYTKGRADYY